MTGDGWGESQRRTTKMVRGAHLLREAILRGELAPGQRLAQQELAVRFGMSPTPVREMLRILEAEGYVTYVPYQGVFVAEASPKEAYAVAPIRAVLEGLACRMAIPRLDREGLSQLRTTQSELERAWHDVNLSQVRIRNYQFHLAIVRASGSDVLEDLVERVWPRFATDLLWMIPGRAQLSIAQHRAVLEAAEKGQADLAGELMSEHIVTVGKSICDFLMQQSEYLPQKGSLDDSEPE